MTIDIGALEKLAQAATPGPWTVDTECLEQRSRLYVAKGCEGNLRGRILEVFKNCLVREPQRMTNAKFIAAANPDAILSLIAEVRALRSTNADLLGACRTAVMALAHATKDNPGCLSAYEKVSEAIDAVRAKEKA